MLINYASTRRSHPRVDQDEKRHLHRWIHRRAVELGPRQLEYGGTVLDLTAKGRAALQNQKRVMGNG